MTRINQWVVLSGGGVEIVSRLCKVYTICMLHSHIYITSNYETVFWGHVGGLIVTGNGELLVDGDDKAPDCHLTNYHTNYRDFSMGQQSGRSEGGTVG